MKYNYLDQRRKDMNAPLNKIRRDGNKEIREKATEAIRMDEKEDKSKEKIVQQVADTTPEIVKSKKESMIVENTKIGVTMVLSKEDCRILGFKPDTTTKEVIARTREKLLLSRKKSKGR